MNILPLIHWDIRTFLCIRHLTSNPLLQTWFHILTQIGDGFFSLILAAAIWIREAFLQRKKTNLPWFIFVTFLISGIVVVILKHIVARPRPISHDPTSFPSGHTTTAFALAATLSFKWQKWEWVFWSTAVLVGISRIAVGAHYPLDVMAGALIGASTAIVYHQALSSREKYLKRTN